MPTWHSHTSTGTRGSMQLAHNLDDRQERATLHTDDDCPDVKNAVSVGHEVMKKYKNLSWLYSKTSSDVNDKESK